MLNTVVMPKVQHKQNLILQKVNWHVVILNNYFGFIKLGLAASSFARLGNNRFARIVKTLFIVIS